MGIKYTHRGGIMRRGSQIINGTEYVYEYDSVWDPMRKYTTHRRNYIGKMVDGVFVPNEKYKLQMKLNEVNARGPVPITTHKRSFYGATYLFDDIGEKLGITRDLAQCFPRTYKQILSVAYYLILEDRDPVSRFPKWAATHTHPYNNNIPSQRSSDLFGSIDEDAKQRFFCLQAKRRLEEEYLAYDTTSISSYSKLLKQVKYGSNKEHDPLAQINLALLYGQESRLPVYYRKLPGNITDVMTIPKVLTDIEFFKLAKVKLVLDRGFYSEVNVNSLYQRHHKFLMAVRTSLRFVRERLDEVRELMMTRANYNSKHRLN
jgi:hypothetical protein